MGNKEQEQKVLASLYDRLYEAVTYSPDGKGGPPYKKDQICFQLAKNMVINPADFSQMMSPINPKGDLLSAAAFSQLVDAIPEPSEVYVDSAAKISTVYGNAMAGAVTDSEMDPKQKALYDKALAFLTSTKTTEDMNGNKKVKKEPSQAALDYDDAQAAYITAVAGYRTAYNDYDFDDIKDQRAFNAVAPSLQLGIDQAWNAWRRTDKDEVEQAQNVLASTIGDALRHVIEEAQRNVSAERKFASLDGSQPPWLPSYALPSNWCDPACKATKITLQTKTLDKKASTTSHGYTFAAKASYGLWHAEGGVEGKHLDKTTSMDAQDFKVTAELITVNIKRPWFDPLLLSMKGWWINGLDQFGLSDGKLGGVLPLIPTAFVVARKVKISAQFSSEETKFMERMIEAKASGGWGPFSISGSYAHGKKTEDFAATMNKGTLELPGMQVLAFISAITPPSPPLSAPSRR